MFISYKDLINIAFLVIGVLWCREVFQRFPKDKKEFKTTQDKTTKYVILFFWVTSAGFIIYIISFFVGIALRIMNPKV